MKMTLAQLKKDVTTKNLYGTLIERFGETDESQFPERLRGERPITKANSVAIFFRNADGRGSECRLKRASLTEYTGNTLTVYAPGFREPNERERQAMEAWEEVTKTEEYQNRAYVDAMTDGSSTYWQHKKFFQDRGLEYLLGYEESQGCKLDFNRRNQGESAYIRDNSIRGEVELKYSIRVA